MMTNPACLPSLLILVIWVPAIRGRNSVLFLIFEKLHNSMMYLVHPSPMYKIYQIVRLAVRIDSHEEVKLVQ